MTVNDDKTTVNDGEATVNNDRTTVNDGEATVKRIFNHTQEQIMALISKNPKITIDDMAVAIGITKRNIEKNIKILKDAGILLRIGGKKKGHSEMSQGTVL